MTENLASVPNPIATTVMYIPSVDFDLLTNSCSLQDFETNKLIILAILKFIKDTNMFVC